MECIRNKVTIFHFKSNKASQKVTTGVLSKQFFLNMIILETMGILNHSQNMRLTTINSSPVTVTTSIYLCLSYVNVSVFSFQNMDPQKATNNSNKTIRIYKRLQLVLSEIKSVLQFVTFHECYLIQRFYYVGGRIRI